MPLPPPPPETVVKESPPDPSVVKTCPLLPSVIADVGAVVKTGTVPVRFGRVTVVSDDNELGQLRLTTLLPPPEAGVNCSSLLESSLMGL